MTYLDTRDLQERLEELEAMEDDYQTTLKLEETDPNKAEPLDEDEACELAELRELAESISDWQYGETLIPVECFADYARELAEDIHPSDAFISWPFTCIDWEQAASELESDYSEVEYNGRAYMVRA